MLSFEELLRINSDLLTRKRELLKGLDEPRLDAILAADNPLQAARDAATEQMELEIVNRLIARCGALTRDRKRELQRA